MSEEPKTQRVEDPTINLKNIAVFLDRDGTLNKDLGYTHLYEKWEWLPNALMALKLLKLSGIKLVVVTNQAGIAKSLYKEEDVILLHRKVDEELRLTGTNISGWYFCPHHPQYTGECDCRKPRPGLLLKAAKDLDIDLSASYMVGDKASDIEAGLNANVRLSILVRTGYGETVTQIPKRVLATSDIMGATEIILEDILSRGKGLKS
jgi:D-glycero-D-manno-heptose 1,7-bisphosphate phosphatase